MADDHAVLPVDANAVATAVVYKPVQPKIALPSGSICQTSVLKNRALCFIRIRRVNNMSKVRRCDYLASAICVV